MPEGYTHVRTARKAAETIHYKIQCPAAFAAGANGPDSFFCFEIWKKRAKRRYDLPGLGSRMHEEKTGAFLRSLCANVKTRPQVEYTLGFLSHYAADTVVHPFICAMCAPGQPYAGKGGHGYLEIALDSTLHAEDTGSALVPVDDVSPLPTGEELADITALLHTCLLETYGEDIPVEYLADAFWHTYRLRGLFPSKHGVRRVFFWLVEPLFGGRGFITGHVSPRQLDKRLPDDWTDPFTGEHHDGGLFALLPKAVFRSEQFMGAALLYLTGYEQWQCSTSSVPAMGFNGIAAAFLGGLNPLGTMLASFFIQHITAGGAYVDKSLYCAQISDLISSIIIYLCGFVLFMKHVMNSSIAKREEKAALKAKAAAEQDAANGKGGDQA